MNLGSILNRNRANAQHSTGPRTEQGKARSSQNAFKHGLSLQRHVVLAHEDPAAFAQLNEELHAIYQPQSPRESLAIDGLAECRWALNRLDAAEAKILLRSLESRLDEVPGLEDADPENTATGETARALAEQTLAMHDPEERHSGEVYALPSLETLLRYRRHWERREQHTLAEFDRAQQARYREARERRAEEQAAQRRELHAMRMREQALKQQLLEVKIEAARNRNKTKAAPESGFVPSEQPVVAKSATTPPATTTFAALA